MTRTLLLGAALAFGLATAANAGVAPAPLGKTESLVRKVAEGCGLGFWRGPNGQTTTARRAVTRAAPTNHHHKSRNRLGRSK